jgi:translation initiation factor 2B subunit (eIF-2B alpha/beta/delta family)
VTAEEIVREIERDRRRGATALAERALDALALSRSAAARLASARPGLPLIGAVVRRALRRGVAAVRRELRQRQARILETAREILPPGARYVVFGGSGTAEAVVRAVGGRRVDGFPADVALVGADALYPGGDFVSARGTAAFVRRAREARCGVFVVASDLKRVRKEVPPEPGLERVNGRLVHAILTETGLHYPPSAAVPGVDPSWIDRGALDPFAGRGRCHPHHGPGVPKVRIRPRRSL